jgi:outer membrane protein OmpA-like peptidoglycan-associated protein
MHTLLSTSVSTLLIGGVMYAQPPVIYSQPPQPPPPPVVYAQPPQPSDPQPIYRVTVISRSLEAVNYEHRGGPTPIDFRGTVLLPYVKGSAIVESHRGSVSVDARLERLEPPTRFGREYLTYVLWAISPEGRPKNLGEVLVDSSNKAHINVTTDMQAFGLMVTAEPYYSVTTPSDVVVAENVVRPDTIGTREEVVAKYELLPRGQYTMTVQPGQLRFVDAQAEKLPYDRYEAVLELYQAENAVAIAQSLGAAQFAPDSFSKAVTLLSQAQGMNARKMDTHAIVSGAREATQMAEDARTITVKRRDEERHLTELRQLQEQAELRRRADQEAAQAQAQADAERAAAEQAQTQVQAARNQAMAAQAAQQAAQQQAFQQRAAVAPPPNPSSNPSMDRSIAQQQHRAELFAQLNSTLATRDTPRGLVVTISDGMFEPGHGQLRIGASQPLANLAAILSSHPGLRVRVEGYADTEPLSDERARSVRSALAVSGAASPGSISAVGYGNSRPIAPAGAEQNRRVEVVIEGDSIGNKALWDHPYSLRSQR